MRKRLLFLGVFAIATIAVFAFSQHKAGMLSANSSTAEFNAVGDSPVDRNPRTTCQSSGIVYGHVSNKVAQRLKAAGFRTDVFNKINIHN